MPCGSLPLIASPTPYTGYCCVTFHSIIVLVFNKIIKYKFINRNAIRLQQVLWPCCSTFTLCSQRILHCRADFVLHWAGYVPGKVVCTVLVSNASLPALNCADFIYETRTRTIFNYWDDGKKLSTATRLLCRDCRSATRNVFTVLENTWALRFPVCHNTAPSHTHTHNRFNGHI